MSDPRTKDDVLRDITDSVERTNTLIEEAKGLKLEVRLWTENQSNGKNIRVKVMNTEPVLDL